MKKLQMLGIFVLVTVVLIACSSKQTGEGTAEGSENNDAKDDSSEELATLEEAELVLWHTLTDHHEEALQKIIDDFNNSQDKVTIVAQAQPYADFQSKLMQAVRNGTGPDLVRTFPSEVVNYINDDLIVDFSPYINDPAFGIDNFSEQLPEGIYKEITQWEEGATYLFPTQLTGEVLFYNKTLYDDLDLDVPKTWKQLEENSRIITEETGKPAFGSDSITDTFIDLIMQGGSEYIDPESKTVAFNNDIALEKLDWFSSNVQEGIFRLVGEDQYLSGPFSSQTVASYIGSSAGIDFVSSGVGDQFELGVAPIPQEGPEEFFPSWINGFVAFKSDEVKERAAYEFLKYHAQPEVMAEWSIAFGSVPAFQDAIDTKEYQEFMNSNIAVQALIPQIEKIGYLPSISGASSVRNNLDEAIQNASLGTKSPQEALDDAEEASNNDLK